MNENNPKRSPNRPSNIKNKTSPRKKQVHYADSKSPQKVVNKIPSPLQAKRSSPEEHIYDEKAPKELHNEQSVNLQNGPKNKTVSIQDAEAIEHGAEFERTLCIIKPNAVSKLKSIQTIIKNRGLLQLKRRRAYLKPEQVREFFLRSLDEENNKYYRLYHKMAEAESTTTKISDVRISNDEKTAENCNLDEYVTFMTSGPVDIVIIAGRGAVSKWLGLMGPENPKLARLTHPGSIRAMFGGESVLRNGVYGSDNADLAEKEIKYFFPDTRQPNVEAGVAASGEYLSKTVNPILLKGLIKLCRQKPDNPLVWLADWLLANNPNSKQ